MATATSISTGDGVWGINADQGGLLVTSISYDYKPEIGMAKSRLGNTIGKTYYNQSVSFSIDGLVPNATPWSTTIASSLVLSNGLSAFLNGGVTGGTTTVEGITQDLTNSDYQKLRITGSYDPFIS